MGRHVQVKESSDPSGWGGGGGSTSSADTKEEDTNIQGLTYTRAMAICGGNCIYVVNNLMDMQTKTSLFVSIHFFKQIK